MRERNVVTSRLHSRHFPPGGGGARKAGAFVPLTRCAWVIALVIHGGALPLAAEFQVNSFTIGSQMRPAISHDSAGGFVVVWRSLGQDGSELGVFGQRFGSSGSPVGGEFQVNSSTMNRQDLPAISHDSIGGFVVVWHSRHQDGDNAHIFGQRFDGSGNAISGEFQISSFTINEQEMAAISHNSSGGFAVAWDSFSQDGSANGIFGQLFPFKVAVTRPAPGGASTLRRFEGS